MKFSKKILNIAPSATVSISAAAKNMKAEGKPVLSFSMGEPDFGSPKAANDAAIDAIKRGESHYTLNTGIIELRTRVHARRGNRRRRREASALRGDGGARRRGRRGRALRAGVGQLRRAAAHGGRRREGRRHDVDGAHPDEGEAEKVVDTMSTGLLPTKEKLLEAIGPKTVGIVVNSPSNPTGAIYPAETLRMIAEVAIEKDLWIIFDEMYERFAYAPAKHVNILNACPEAGASATRSGRRR